MGTAGAAAAPGLAAELLSFTRGSGLAGAVAGVVHGGELLWSGAAGFADVERRVAAAPAALARIASITKTVTGTAVMQLRDAGLLDLDEPAVTWLPELRGAVSPFGRIEAVTIRRMLAHESGLATEPVGTDWSVSAYRGDPRQALERPGDIIVRVPPGSQHKYSDLAYQLLGEIVTRVTGTPYGDYVRRAILDPLGMTSTGFEPLPDELAARCATGYLERSLAGEHVPAALMPPVWAEGGLWSCVADLGRWLSFQLSAYRDGAAGSPVLAAASLREMHRARYLADDAWTEAWGLSWCVRRADDGLWITHAGGVPGFTSEVCFDPRSQVGAVVLVNGNWFTGLPAACLAAIARDAVRGVPPPAGPFEPVPPGPGQLEPVPAEPAPAEAAPQEYRPLLGIYARAELTWVIQLEWRSGTLAFASPGGDGWRLPLEPAGEPGVFTVGPGDNLAGEPVVFHRLPDGRIGSVMMAGTTLVRLDSRAAGAG